MAEWLGRGLQNLVQRFESASDLQNMQSRRLDKVVCFVLVVVCFYFIGIIFFRRVRYPSASLVPLT